MFIHGKFFLTIFPALWKCYLNFNPGHCKTLLSLFYATEIISHPFPDSESFIQFSPRFFPNIAVISYFIWSISWAVIIFEVLQLPSHLEWLPVPYKADRCILSVFIWGEDSPPISLFVLAKIGTTLDLTKHYVDIFLEIFGFFCIRNVIQVHGLGWIGWIVFLFTKASPFITAWCLLA